MMMKKILVTGAGGYIGSSFCTYMEQFPGKYQIDTVSLWRDEWKRLDFSGYDAVMHAAGLAHIRETKANRPLYDRINRDLTVEVAKKAKAEGVRQFVFLSSMSVYGLDEGAITEETVPHPRSGYGKSKLEAENLLREMEEEIFRVAVLRPPMVYGPGCKGNYRALVKLAEVLPVCPDYLNRRSVISIENLCAEIKQVIDQCSGGILCPQDPEYICTCRMICEIAEANGKTLPRTKLLNFIPALLRRFTKKGRKAFGSLVYSNESKRGHAGV